MIAAEDELERLEDLLALRLERELLAPEETELAELLSRHPQHRAEDFELAAGALLAGLKTSSLSAELQAKLAATMPAPKLELAVDNSDTRKIPPVRITRRSFGGWIAAALAAGTAAVGWWARLSGRWIPKPDPALSLGERRARLLAEAEDALTLPFAPGGDPLVKTVEGDLVWSTARQAGFMRFGAGMPANDPREHQYQLWIFDGRRDQRYPVDGGVFDVAAQTSAGAEVLVEITPKVRVGAPALFAVTLEPPGGVVVSSREHILVVAKPA